MRRLTILFGGTAPAAAATLAAVFAGLGIGGLALGSLSPRWKRPLRAFGWVEMGAGAASLLVEPILRLTSAALASSPAREGGTWLFLLGATASAMAAILPAAFLMGGSLPLLGEALAGDRGRLGVTAGGLYAVNTLGAALGALAVPETLLPSLGASGASLAAAGGSLLVGALAWIADTRLAPPARHPARAAAPAPAAAAAASNPIPRLALALAFLSGLLVLSFETLAAGMLAQVHESSIYAFAIVLAVFLLGLAAGAGVARRLLHRGAGVKPLLDAAWTTAGALLIVTPFLFLALTHGLAFVAVNDAADRWRLAGIAAAAFGPAALLCGAVLPLVMEIAGGSAGRHAGPALGAVLGANTAGAIAGPLLSTFALRPGLGLWGALAIAGAAMIAAGDLSRPARPILRLARYAALIAALAALRPDGLPRVRLGEGESLLGVKDGAFGTVAVVEQEGSRRIKLDSSYLIGGTLSTGDERLQAHIPLLLHPAPRRAAFLGMGTGISAGAALLHPVEEIEVVEIVPEIVEAAGGPFREANLGLVGDPRVRVVMDDARRWLPSAGGAFDVVVGDLFVPWRRAESAMFTRESFLAARRALAPGGVFCQWIPLYQMTEEDFRSVARTFVEVFPSASLWRGDLGAGQPAVGLVGTASGGAIDPEAADARARQLAARGDPSNPYLSDPAGLWLYFVGLLDPDDPWMSSGRVNRDDRPWLELAGPPPAGGDRSGRRALGGRRAAELLDRWIRSEPDARLSSLVGKERLGWRAAGRRLWEAALLESEGLSREADAAGLRALSMLPPPIQKAALGRVLCESGCPDPLEPF